MKDFAVFTIVRNEPFFLPIWCDYYSRQFGEENIFILDNSTSDDSVVNVKKRWTNISVGSVPSEEAMMYGWTTDVAREFQRVCLEKYRVVIFADADEYLIPSEKYTNLRNYCDVFLRSPRKYARAEGWATIHQIDEEPPIDTRVHGYLLENRGSMWRTKSYDKTLISKVPLNWAKGIHTIRNVAGVQLKNDPIDKDLFLCHARDVDLDVFHQRCIARSKMKSSIGCGYGSTDLETVRTYFKTMMPMWQSWDPDPGVAEFLGSAQRIPDSWKHLLRY